jgi:hypothetical protein
VTPSEPPILSGNELFELLASQQANGIFPERIDGFIIHGFKRKSGEIFQREILEVSKVQGQFRSFQEFI